MKTTTGKQDQGASENPKPFFNPQPFFSPTREAGLVRGNATPNQFFRPVPNNHNPTTVIHAELIINEPGDKYEQEADAMSEKVLLSGEAALGDDPGQAKATTLTSIQRACASCMGEEKMQRSEIDKNQVAGSQYLMRQAEGGGSIAPPDVATQINGSKGGGAPLQNRSLVQMNQTFGTDFSAVRVHDSSQAAEMCNGIQANAFTHGTDIYFNQGKYSPETQSGQKLLGHELTHVVQQNVLPGKQSTNQVSNAVLRDVIQRDVTPLTPEERVEYRRQTGNRIDRAFTAFITAVEQNRAAIKESARRSASFTEMIIEVVFGLAAPGLAGGVVALASRLPASLAASRIAIAAMDAGAVQRVLGAAVRVGREVIRRNSTRLFGETELDQYAIVLQSEFHMAAQTIDSNLPNLSDEALLLTMAAYDASVTDVVHYRPILEDILRRYAAQVLPIGSRQVNNVTDPYDRQITIATGVMWVSHTSGPVLVLGTATNGRLRFQSFIDADMRNAALERGQQQQERGIQTIPWNDSYIGNLPSSIPPNAARP